MTMFERGLRRARAWLPPHWAMKWSKKYMAGWHSGTAERINRR